MKIEEIMKESFRSICKYYKKDFNIMIDMYKKQNKFDTLFDTPCNRKK